MDGLIWTLIYGGLLSACLGLFVRRGDLHLGWVLIVAGGLAALAGAVLIFLRSRRP